MSAEEKTQRLDIDEYEFTLALAKQAANKTITKNLGKPKEILLLGKTVLRRLELYSHQNTYILGRFSDSDRYTNYIDLSPFGAQELGVSRNHVQIQMEGDTIYLTDLNSRNGTYLYGSRLEPNQPVSLQSGTSLILGRLYLQLVFRFKESLESSR
jgi:hypothetical protein